MRLLWKSTLQWIAAGFILFGFVSRVSLALAQGKPTIEIGGIAQVAAVKPEAGESPLRVNDGNYSFVNRLVLLAEARLGDRLALYLELQSLNNLQVGLYGLSIVYRPFADPGLHFEAGKFLLPFGNFLPRHWASENPLFDFPLPYHYRTTVSAFQLPRSGDNLLAVRGMGHHLEYPKTVSAEPSLSKVTDVYLSRPAWGLPLLARDVYVTGVQGLRLSKRLFVALALTNGAPCYPVDVNNSNGVLIGGRLRYTVLTGLELGISLATAPYLDKNTVQGELSNANLRAEDYRQTIAGLDFSFSRGHWVVFAEGIFSRWQSPFLNYNLDVWSGYLEGKYTLAARWYVAARFSGLRFEKIPDPNDVDGDGELQEPWDYPVIQGEGGLGCRLTRNLVIKAVYQHHRTFAAPDGDPHDDVIALQAVVFF